MCVCVYVCAVCKKKIQKAFVYINYSVCIDVCETKINKKKPNKQTKNLKQNVYFDKTWTFILHNSQICLVSYCCLNFVC